MSRRCQFSVAAIEYAQFFQPLSGFATRSMIRRSLSLLLMLVFIVAGFVFGAMNNADATLWFGRWSVTTGIGVALLGAAAIGAMIGGLVIGLALSARPRRLPAASTPVDSTVELTRSAP